MEGLGPAEPLADGRILLARGGGIGWITFNKPGRMNAMCLAMWQGLAEALAALEADAQVRVVVLSGAGERAFVSGADISEFDSVRAAPDDVARYNTITEAANAALAGCSKPTIAAIRGYCIGGGLGLALDCDIRLAATDAQFAIPAARLGLAYGAAGVRRLVHVVGPAAAAELLFTADRFDAEAARGMGLVREVVAPEALAGRAQALATRIAANAPLTLVAAKAAIAAAASPPDAHEEARIAAMVRACFESEDYAEGRRAFAEKRAPAFRGR